MGNFLNIIKDNLDDIDLSYYFVKGSDEERMLYLKKHFKYFNFKEINESKLIDAFNNPNEKYYYFISSFLFNSSTMINLSKLTLNIDGWFGFLCKSIKRKGWSPPVSIA